ncbi:MAG TPA: hypothetical protein VMT03_22500 [Polyangia bacterium]|nr:hypothetical protein [Polyangia bacterium]
MLRSCLVVLSSSFVLVAAGCGGGGTPAGRTGGNGGHAGNAGGHAGSSLGGQAGGGQAGAGGDQTGGGGGGAGGQAGAGTGGQAGAGGQAGGGTGGQSGAGGQAGGGTAGQAGAGGQAGGGAGGGLGGGGGPAGGAGGQAGAGAQGGAGGQAGAGGAIVCPTPAGGSPGAASDNVVFASNVTVSTVAGGDAAASQIVNPVQLVFEPGQTSFIVSDFDANALLRVTLTGNITALTSSVTSFQRPYGLAYDATNDILYSETDANPSGNHDITTATVWRIDRTSGQPSTVKANIGGFRSIFALPDGHIVLSDRGNHVVNLLDPATGSVTPLAGSSQCVGGVNGTGAQAEFTSPYGAGLLPNGDLVIADDQLRVLRRVTLAGVVTAFAGDGGPAGTIDGPAASARFVQPRGVAVDAAGNVYVADTGSRRIRRVGTDGMVTTLAGSGTAGFMDGAGNVAKFFGLEGIAVSTAGTVYVTDGTEGADTGGVAYNRIRAITIGP